MVTIPFCLSLLSCFRSHRSRCLPMHACEHNVNGLDFPRRRGSCSRPQPQLPGSLGAGGGHQQQGTQSAFS